MNLLEIMQKEEFEQVFSIMEQSFPKEEMRIYEKQKKLLELPFYHIEVVKNKEKKIVAFLAYWKLENFYFIEHVAVSKSERGKKIGEKLLKEAFNKWNCFVVLEVEPPETEIAKRRIDFYKRIGFLFNNFEYFQLPLREGFEKIPLKIMSYPRNISKEEFEQYKNMLYQTVYQH